MLCALACVLGMQASFSNQCDSFYSKVTYALNHTKKGLSATNFEHQMYYAERALAALEKGKPFMDDCSCEKAKDKTLDTLLAEVSEGVFITAATLEAGWITDMSFTAVDSGV